jgi:hypothetical protein
MPKKNHPASPEPMNTGSAPTVLDTCPPVVRVRFLRAVDAKIGRYQVGQSAVLPSVLARNLIGFGIAEEDKSLDSAPEKKGFSVMRGPNVTLEVLKGTGPDPQTGGK